MEVPSGVACESIVLIVIMFRTYADPQASNDDVTMQAR
ncbi:hypothetical protein FBZ91_107154 [Nitrospirillum viridazoti]|nr:hypothetical protein FBZ91_107154 [Nitrospirillum amazonense]